MANRRVSAGFIVAALIVGATLASGSSVSAATPAAHGLAQADRCVKVGPDLVKAVNAGMRPKYRSVKVVKAWAVRSRDFEKIWYVSGRMTNGVMGTWATNRKPLGVSSGLIFAVDKVTLTYSVWGEAARPGSPAGAVKDMKNDGALASRACVLRLS